MRAVAYLRVSTAQQGRSGLGLEAQRSAVSSLAHTRELTIRSEFVEVESGSLNARPELEAALRQAKMTGAVLVIAKLDRLSRNAAFLLALRDSGVRFLAADMPDANDLTIGIMAVIAQAEREAISRRTAEALAAVKDRLAKDGWHLSKRSGRIISRLGNPNGSAALRKVAAAGAGALAAHAAAERRAKDLEPVISGLVSRGLATHSALAKALNDQGVLTARNARWHPATVGRLLARLKIDGSSPTAADGRGVRPAE